MRRFTIVHNIPSPYRLHLFRMFDRRLHARGISLRVHFMARMHAERPHWKPDPAELTFDHIFHRDVGYHGHGQELHANPGIIAALVRERPDVLMVGGPWNTPTTVAVSALIPAKRRIAWIEGNLFCPGRITGLARAFKASVLSRFDVIATPGLGGAQYTRLILPDTKTPIADLPNLVDETRFTSANADPNERAALRAELGVAHDEKLAIWNARLIPTKGVANFLEHLRPADLDGWRLSIFGEGPELSRVHDVIARNGLAERVTVRAYWPYARMPALYRAADLMLLPSIEDPNPLSIVEALHTGLPLLVSNRIGNHAEALREGENGWTVDPLDGASVRRGIDKAFRADVATLTQMGAVSRTVAAKSWSSEPAIDRFLDRAGVFA